MKTFKHWLMENDEDTGVPTPPVSVSFTPEYAVQRRFRRTSSKQPPGFNDIMPIDRMGIIDPVETLFRLFKKSVEHSKFPDLLYPDFFDFINDVDISEIIDNVRTVDQMKNLIREKKRHGYFPHV